MDAGGPLRCPQYAAQCVYLGKGVLQRMARGQVCPSHDAEPVARPLKLLQPNAQFMKEIPPTLRAAGFLIVGTWEHSNCPATCFPANVSGSASAILTTLTASATRRTAMSSPFIRTVVSYSLFISGFPFPVSGFPFSSRTERARGRPDIAASPSVRAHSPARTQPPCQGQ